MSFFIVVWDEEAGKNRPFATFSHAQPVQTQKRSMERQKGPKNTERVQALLLLLRRPKEINPNTFKYKTTRDGPDRLPLTSLKKKHTLCQDRFLEKNTVVTGAEYILHTVNI